MADMVPLKNKLTFGDYTITQGETIAAVPLKTKLTINPVTWIGSPVTVLVPPLRTRMTFGRYRWVQHAGALAEETPANYNGTTYEVLMTGGHINLPDLRISQRTIDAEEGAEVHEEKILAYRNMLGLAASSDYGADPAVIGKTTDATFQNWVIETVAVIDDPVANVYSSVLNTGGQLYIFRHLMTGTTSKLVEAVPKPFGIPPILQMRAIPGVGLAVATSAGFYFFNLALTVMQPRNSGIVDATGGQGRLSLLPDGSVMIYGGDRLYKTVDLGLRWTDASGNLPPFTEMKIRDVYVASATHWYLATNQGVWKTTNGGGAWTLVNNNLTPYLGPFVGNTPVGAFSVHGSASNPNIVLVGLRGHVARTTNGGATWTVFGKTEGLSSKVPGYRVHQAGTVLLASYGELYEFVPTAYLWRSEDDGASWQVAFPGANAMYVNDFASAFGFSSDLVVIGTFPLEWSIPATTEIGTRTSVKRRSSVTVNADVDTATLAAITARMVTVDGKKARLIIQQVKDYRTQKYYQTIASAEYQSSSHTRSSLAGLVSLTLTAQDKAATTVTPGRSRPPVARVIPEAGVVVGVEGEGSNITISMLIDETYTAGSKISWLGTEYVASGIKYAISDGSRLMSLNTATRIFAVATSPARAGITKQIPVFKPPHVTARSSFGFAGGSTPTASAGRR